MTLLRWFTVSSVLLAVATLVDGGETNGKLEGTWVFEKDGAKIELRFAKSEFTASIDGKTFKGTYTTDPKKKPKQLDILFKDDPKLDGKTGLCIYEVTGDTLKWAANDPGRGNPRLKDFPDKERLGGEYIYLVLKRAGQ